MERHIIITDSFGGLQGQFRINLDDSITDELIRVIKENNLILQPGDKIEIRDFNFNTVNTI